MDYKNAGVDVEKGEELARRIARKVRSTYGERVHTGVGGFAGLYRRGDKLLAAGVDGVGTKLLLARELEVYDTIGVDLVAMCVNDILCVGARPLFFMDYLAVEKLELPFAEAIIDGIVNGCRQGGCALLGGESAEMPGLYHPGDFDLAGMAVGEVDPDRLLGGAKVKPGQTLIALASSGFHSNGYSLLRKLVGSQEKELKRQLLRPTRIYWDVLRELLADNLISAAAHITGGGLTNIPRVCEEVDYFLERLPPEEELPSEMGELFRRSGLSKDQLHRTFNMGMGMVLVTGNPDGVVERLNKRRERHWIIGETRSGTGRLLFN